MIAIAAVVVGTVLPLGSATASAAKASTAIAQTAGAPVSSTSVKSTLVGFNAGNIISDAVFTNSGTMTEAEIQTFFNSKVSRCLGGRDEAGEPIVCLKDFRATSVDMKADRFCQGYKGAANESAARIIHRVAQACGINPQVLIVMLQKEQGLVTHTWPSGWRYRIALGQGCPDDAACDPGYIGFFHQIYGAARQMQIYMEGQWFTYYAPGKTWNILYNPNRNCGSSPVYVANKATSALYYYTPYQPNAAALRAGYGSGDGCSAYGNRNFYNYFTDWFGSTQTAVPFSPTLTSLDADSFVMSVESNGDVWAYPHLKGAWGDRVRVSTGVTGVKRLFGMGDVDGDGHRDFVALRADGSAILLRGDGTSKLSSSTKLSGDWSGVVLAAQAGDFDGDGVPDLFTTAADGRLFLRSGDDRGGFRAPKVVGVGWGMMNLITGNGDFDGDGRADLVARDTQGRLYLYSGNGNGGWLGSRQIGNGWGMFADVFNAGDFTGDGHPDLLAVEPAGAMRLYRGSASGAVSDGMVIGTGWHTAVSRTGSGPAVTKPRALPGGAGDLDGVPGGDVVAQNAGGDVFIYGTTGTGNWGATTRPSGVWSAGDKVVPLGDFNGDGRNDLGRIDANGTFHLHPGVPGGGLGASVVIGNGWGSFTRVVGGIDFDGNRTPDVLVVTQSGGLLLYRGNGAGGWGAGSGIPIGQGWGGMKDLFSVGDFDGDGYGDLIGRTADGILMLYPTTGGGNWGGIRAIGQGWTSMKAVFSSGDFDGNGTNDVLGVAANGDMYLYRGNGSGGWGTSFPQIGNGWHIFTTLG